MSSLLVTIFGAVLVAFGVFYAGMMLRFAVGFHRVRKQDLPPLPEPPPFVSVIVPARDEEESIVPCLRSLLQSDYPDERFEIIVVDDFSQDRTAELVERFSEHYPDLVRLVRLEHCVESEEQGHKGVALSWGVHKSRGSFILTTDADCTVDPGWVRAMARTLNTPKAAFVAGSVRMEGDTLFGKLQALEFAGLVGIGAGAIGAGIPNMCNSASIGYRRRVFEALRLLGRSDEPTPWDDELMLHHLKRHPALEVRFAPFPEAVVTTHPESTLGAFWRQRRRWASTGARYPSRSLVFSIGMVYVFYVLLLVSLVALFFVPKLWPWVAAGFGLKVLSEAALLVPAVRHLGMGRLLWLFLPEQLLQLPYVVLTGAAGAIGRPAWKGRRIP